MGERRGASGRACWPGWGRGRGALWPWWQFWQRLRVVVVAPGGGRVMCPFCWRGGWVCCVGVLLVGARGGGGFG